MRTLSYGLLLLLALAALVSPPATADPLAPCPAALPPALAAAEAAAQLAWLSQLGAPDVAPLWTPDGTLSNSNLPVPSVDRPLAPPARCHAGSCPLAAPRVPRFASAAPQPPRFQACSRPHRARWLRPVRTVLRRLACRFRR